MSTAGDTNQPEGKPQGGGRAGPWLVRPEARERSEFTGERFVPGVGGEIEAEHVSRYLFAAPLCAGKRVLDIACGEGFGSAMLAGVAKEVVGVDIDTPTVERARRNYGAGSGGLLSFEVGSCEKIPGKKGSFDVVVSFETIEHIEDHAGFLREVRRVLRPGGVFVCSTPDKSVYLAGQEPNPFHKKELTAEEFEALLSRRFEHAAFFGQRLVSGAVITRGGAGRTDLVRTDDGRAFDRSAADEGATYRIGVCSDGRLPRVGDQVFSDARHSIGRLTRLAAERRSLEDRAETLERALAAAHGRLEETEGDAARRAAEAEAGLRRATEDAARLVDQRDRAAAARDQALAEVARLSEDRGRLLAERAAAERERDAAIRDAASVQVDYQRAAGELDRVRESLLEAREKAAAAQAGLAATRSEHQTLREAAERSARERDAAMESQKRAEIHAARMEERALRPAGVLAVAGRAASVRGLGLAARVARALRLPGAERLTVARRAALFRASRLFDAGAYLRAHPDVAAAGVDPAWHMAARGGIEGRCVPPVFDAAWYLHANPDVAAAGVHPFEHYITRGVIEGRAGLAPEGGAAAVLAAGSKAGPLAGAMTVAMTGGATAAVEIISPTGPQPGAVVVDRAQLERTKVLAFYLPQFHPIPENDAWWGKGFTEWTNVTRGRPMFAGHAQPFLPGELGFYDLRVPEVRERQAELARAAGIHGFCYHHYWFNGRRVLERPLAEVLASGSPDFPFCVCWANENWTRRWDGHEQEVLLRQQHTLAGDRRFILDLMPYLEDPRHVRVDGRPVILVYRPDLMADARDTAAVWRDECHRAGVGDIHLCAVQFRTTDPGPLGFDAAVEFPPHHFPAPEITRRVAGMDPAFGGAVMDYAAGVREMVRSPKRADYRLYRGVMPSWDNTARRMEHGIIHHGATPELYEAWLRSAINQRQPDDGVRENLVFVNAWNEWAEGTVLEPRKDVGDAYLRATARALGVAAEAGPTVATAGGSVAGSVTGATDASSGGSAVEDGPVGDAAMAPSIGAGLEDRLKRVVRTNKVLNSLVNRHPELKTRAAVVMRRVTERGSASDASVAETGGGPGGAGGAEHGLREKGAAEKGVVGAWKAGRHEQCDADARPILIVSHDACLAGAQIVVLELLRHYASVPSVRVFHLLCGSGVLEPAFRDLATTCCIDDLTRRGLSRERAIASALDALPPVDAALCNTAAVPDAVRACAQRGIRVVSYLHELPTTIDSLLGGEKTVRTIDRHAGEIVVVSEFVRDRLCGHYGLDPARLRVLHMGVFPSKSSPPDRAGARAAVEAELGLAPGTPIVLGCGTIHHRKGTDLWVRAAARAVRIARESGGSAPCFVWVGWDQAGPEMRAWCEHDARAAGIGGQVRFIGVREDTQPYFAAADVFALSSREDPFPLVNLEALVCGTPVVAFEGAGGAPEAILDPGGDAGVVVRYGDAEAMGEAIAAMLADPALRARAGGHARRIARDRLGWARYIGGLTRAMTPADAGRAAVGVGA